MNFKRHFFQLTLSALACGLMPWAQAQSNWPTKTLRIVVPFAPGSFTDLSARALAVELSEQLGQQVVVENKGGAGGTIGADAVAKSAPDGHTLLLTDNSFVMAAGLYPRLPFDPQKDFAQISAIAESPSIMIARAELPAKTVVQLVEAARAKPMDFMFGSGGRGRGHCRGDRGATRHHHCQFGQLHAACAQRPGTRFWRLGQRAQRFAATGAHLRRTRLW